MNVLVACEESQVVCNAFRKKGHNAFSCDIIDCSGGHPEWHIKQNVLPLLNGNCSFTTCDGKEHSIDGKWDLIIAFPPCTYISNAGACRLYPKKGFIDEERYKLGLKAKDFFLMILNADCEKICVENPVHSKVFKMPEHSQEIQPYEHGHPVSKKTRLWLKNLPLLQPTNIVECKSTFLPSGTSRKIKAAYGCCRGHDSLNRSKTFEGIARAMAAQWGNDLAYFEK